MPLFPDAALAARRCFIALAVIGIIYGAVVAMMQTDIKKLVAYSSVSHLGFVMLGLFALNLQGVQGAIYQMLNHGLSTGALFLLVGMIYDRRHTRLIDDFGGLWKQMPIFSALLSGRHLFFHRPARTERLRRRVSDPARRLRRDAAAGPRWRPRG